MVRSRMVMIAVGAVFATVAIVADYSSDVGQGALHRRARIAARHERREHRRNTMHNRDEMNQGANHENHHKMNHNDENMMEHHGDIENGNGQGGHLFGDF